MCKHTRVAATTKAPEGQGIEREGVIFSVPSSVGLSRVAVRDQGSVLALSGVCPVQEWKAR